MRTLAIECATEACSVALFDGDDCVAAAHDVLGRGHAERLIPMIAELPDRGRAQRLLVSRGPGSFTGVRIGIAAAQGLALAWQAEVLGYPTLALVAAMAQQEHPGTAVTACMTGGHGEWFVQDFAPDGLPEGDCASLKPEAAAARPNHAVITGSCAQELGALVAGSGAHPSLPNARSARLLNAALLTKDCAPIYGRAPDAKPAQPRAGAGA